MRFIWLAIAVVALVACEDSGPVPFRDNALFKTDAGTPQRPSACQGLCGGTATSGCGCDPGCGNRGDCCSDYASTCASCAVTLTGKNCSACMQTYCCSQAVQCLSNDTSCASLYSCVNASCNPQQYSDWQSCVQNQCSYLQAGAGNLYPYVSCLNSYCQGACSGF